MSPHPTSFSGAWSAFRLVLRALLAVDVSRPLRAEVVVQANVGLIFVTSSDSAGSVPIERREGFVGMGLATCLMAAISSMLSRRALAARFFNRRSAVGSKRPG